jgi:hypothetical protein
MNVSIRLIQTEMRHTFFFPLECYQTFEVFASIINAISGNLDGF